MLKADGKERIFSTTFVMKPGETVVLTEQLPGAEVRFVTQPKLSQSSNPGIVPSVSGNVITLALPNPVPNAIGFVFDESPTLNSGPAGTLSGRIAVQLLGNASVVNFEAYLERNTGYNLL